MRGVLLAGAAGLVLALVERVVRPGPRVMRAVRATVALGVVAAALGGLGLAATNAGAIRADLDDRWQTFKSSDPVTQTTANRLGARYSDKRYDYWRVSMAMWREAPVRGAGAGSFEPVYASEKRHGRHARFPHDVWLRTLGETGLVGLGLLGGALIALVGGLLVAYRRADSAARAVTAMAFAAGGYVLLHASIDFLEEFPAIIAPALGLAVVALVAATARSRPAVDAAGPREGGDPQGPAVLGGEGPPARPSRGRRAAGGLGAAAGCLLLAAFLASLVAPYLSHRWVERAQATWREDRAGAVRDLDRAARVNPWSDDPHVTLGTIALVVGDERAARVGFARALRVERSWYPYFQLGLLDAQAGRFARAERRLARASLLNRDDDLIAEAREDVAARKRIDALAFTRRALRTSLDNAGGVG